MTKVSVITRTKDRLIMLRRAAESVCAQEFKDFEWIVVNDGGDPAPVDALLSEYQPKISSFKVVHHPVNKGMEAASNAGIAASIGEFLVIHDDDDTWEPRFLAETLAFLEAPTGKRYGGVITQTTKVDEVMLPDRVVIKKRRFWNPMLGYYPQGAVHISDLSVINQFPPIAFLYRRTVLEKVGGYDESLPVLGDWDFNLRFIMDSDIAVLPLPLANYHHRRAATGSYGNSVHAGSASHLGFEAFVRNRAIRQGDPLLAQVMLSGRQHLEARKYVSKAVILASVVWKVFSPMARLAVRLRDRL